MFLTRISYKNLLSHKLYGRIGLVQIEVVVHPLEALSYYERITPHLYGFMRMSWIAPVAVYLTRLYSVRIKRFRLYLHEYAKSR